MYYFVILLIIFLITYGAYYITFSLNFSSVETCFLGMAILGIYVLFSSLLGYLRLYPFKNTPGSELKSAPMGFVKIKGFVRNFNCSRDDIADIEIHEHNDFQIEMLRYFLEFVKGDFFFLRKNKKEFFDVKPFYIEFEKHRVAVDTLKAAFLLKRKYPINGDLLRRYVISEGDELLCLGSIDKYEGSNAKINRMIECGEIKEKIENIITRDTKKPYFLISNLKEKEIINAISGNYRRKFFFGSLLFIVGVSFIFITAVNPGGTVRGDYSLHILIWSLFGGFCLLLNTYGNRDLY